MRPTLCLVPVLRGYSWVGETQEPGFVLALRGQFGGEVTGTRSSLALVGHNLVT